MKGIAFLLLTIVTFIGCKKNSNPAPPTSNTTPTTPGNAPCYLVYRFETECSNASSGSPMNITSGTLTVKFFKNGFTGTVVPTSGLTYVDTVKFNTTLLSTIDTVYTFNQSSNVFNPYRTIRIFWPGKFEGEVYDGDTIPLWKEYIYLPDSLDRNTYNSFSVNGITPSFFPFEKTQAIVTVSDEALPVANTFTQSAVLGTYSAVFPTGCLFLLNANPQGAIKVDISEYHIYEDSQFSYMTQRVHHYNKKIKLK